MTNFDDKDEDVAKGTKNYISIARSVDVTSLLLIGLAHDCGASPSFSWQRFV